MAMEEDFDKNGINDVLIKDMNGNLAVVNGYAVRKSDYSYRQKFLWPWSGGRNTIHTKTGPDIDTMAPNMMVIALASN